MNVLHNVIRESQKVETGQTKCGYFFSYKWNEVLIHAITWINMENTMLSEEARPKKDHMSYDLIYIKCPEEVNL